MIGLTLTLIVMAYFINKCMFRKWAMQVLAEQGISYGVPIQAQTLPMFCRL